MEKHSSNICDNIASGFIMLLRSYHIHHAEKRYELRCHKYIRVQFRPHEGGFMNCHKLIFCLLSFE